jgi:hypothetical protein
LLPAHPIGATLHVQNLEQLEAQKGGKQNVCVFFIPSTTQHVLPTLVMPNWCHCAEVWTSSTPISALCFFRD